MNEQQLQLLVRLAETGQAGQLLQLLGDNVGQYHKQLTNTLIYGGGGLFSVCASDQLINASLNDVGLAGHIPWLPTTAEVRRQAAITAIGDLAGGSQPDDQCADPPGTDWRGCEIEWCLGRIRYKSPEYDRLDQGETWCEKVPRFRMFGNISVGGAVIAPQGSQIDNDAEWGAVQASVGIRQTLGRWLYTGNRATNNNMFNGLQVLVNTGYVDVKSRIACPALDADVKDFEGDCITDSTITKNIYRYLDAVVGRIIERAIGAGLDMPTADDLRIVARSEVVNALYEYWCCTMSACTPAQGLTISADWARQTTDDLRARSRLRVRGMDIPVVQDDYQPFEVSTGGTGWMSDIYVLTMQVGGLPVVFGEYKNFNAGVGDALTGWSQELYGGRVVDDGRFYVWQERTNTCFDTRVALKPRLIILLPFLSGRVTNVCVEPLQAPLSPYPPDGSPYYPDGGAYESSYDAGSCG